MNLKLDGVVADTVAHREKFETFCRSLTPEETVRPIPDSHWRVKDYIAHLATIDIWVGQWFDALADGREFRFRNADGTPFNIDTWNDHQVNPRRDSAIDDLLKEAATERAKLFATFERFSDETLDRRFDFHKNNISFLEYLKAWALHDPAHVWDSLPALPERKAEPWVREWMNSLRVAAPTG
jgi:DinB superfamily